MFNMITFFDVIFDSKRGYLEVKKVYMIKKKWRRFWIQRPKVNQKQAQELKRICSPVFYFVNEDSPKIV